MASSVVTGQVPAHHRPAGWAKEQPLGLGLQDCTAFSRLWTDCGIKLSMLGWDHQFPDKVVWAHFLPHINNKHSWHRFVVSPKWNWHYLAIDHEISTLVALRSSSLLHAGSHQDWGCDVSWSALRDTKSRESLKLPFLFLQSQDHPVSSLTDLAQ